jgi:hypothetical protein
MASVPTGGINETKKRLIALIQEAEPVAHVYGDWYLAQESIYGPKTGPKLPAVTVRLGPAQIWDAVYSRLIPEAGDMALYSFSAHCFASACTESGEEKYKYAHDLADKIMTYLNSRDWNGSPHTSYQIVDVSDLTARESDPQRSKRRKVCRVIVEGMMTVKRIDA